MLISVATKVALGGAAFGAAAMLADVIANTDPHTGLAVAGAAATVGIGFVGYLLKQKDEQQQAAIISIGAKRDADARLLADALGRIVVLESEVRALREHAKECRDADRSVAEKLAAVAEKLANQHGEIERLRGDES